MVAEESAATPEWVVCFAEARDVTGRAVACPLSRRQVRVEACLDCRHLGSVSDEHHTSRWCCAGDVEPDPLGET